jgi:hypothetical protein
MRSFVHVITAQGQEHAGHRPTVRATRKRPHAAGGFLGLRRT